MRVRSASLEAEVTEASAARKKDARRARRGAQAAHQEQAIYTHIYKLHIVVRTVVTLY